MDQCPPCHTHSAHSIAFPLSVIPRSADRCDCQMCYKKIQWMQFNPFFHRIDAFISPPTTTAAVSSGYEGGEGDPTPPGVCRCPLSRIMAQRFHMDWPTGIKVTAATPPFSLTYIHVSRLCLFCSLHTYVPFVFMVPCHAMHAESVALPCRSALLISAVARSFRFVPFSVHDSVLSQHGPVTAGWFSSARHHLGSTHPPTAFLPRHHAQPRDGVWPSRTGLSIEFTGLMGPGQREPSVSLEGEIMACESSGSPLVLLQH